MPLSQALSQAAEEGRRMKSRAWASIAIMVALLGVVGPRGSWGLPTSHPAVPILSAGSATWLADAEGDDSDDQDDQDDDDDNSDIG